MKTDEDDNKVDTSPWDHVQEEMGQEYKGKDSKQDTQGKDDYQSDGGYKECSKIELAKFKRQLLAYHCRRFEEPNCKLEVDKGRFGGPCKIYALEVENFSSEFMSLY